MISDCLNSIAGDNDTRKRLYEYEKGKYNELNNVILKDNGNHSLQLEVEKIKSVMQDSIAGKKSPVIKDDSPASQVPQLGPSS